MSQYPLNELKRRLQDDDTPLPKRFRLAKNVVQSHHFPTAPKERVIAEWLDELIKDNKFSSKELGDVLGWLNNVDDFTSDLKCKLIKVVSRYLHSNIIQNNDSINIIAFLESTKISNQLHLQIEDFLLITTTLLQNLHNESNYTLVENILNNISKYYKESKKKLEFIIKFLEGDHLETIFSFLDSDCHSAVINFCQNVLFPLSKKQFFSSFLINLIRKDNIDELIIEKGDNIQSVLKIMSSFFTFPKGRSDKDPKFLADFIYTFVRCFRTESQMCFAFYIMVSNAFNMTQNYMTPAMNMPPIIFENDDKIKRNLFLKMLEVLHLHEVDITVRLTDTLGEKIAKVEIKKTFIAFLQAVMMGQLKLEGKLDKVTLQIIKIALKLDPSIVEQKLDKILPHIMTVKKNKTDIVNTYKDTINYLLETLFKLSRGAEFINQIIPHIKVSLEASNVEQFEFKQKLTHAVEEDDIDKIKGTVLTGDDVLPSDCIELYGKLSSELMFRQNKVLLLSLQKDFEENCLMMLEEGFVSPSIITLSEVLSAILSSFFRHNKMADHTVPLPIAEDFWAAFQDFEHQCLNKFGKCVLKLNYNPPLVFAFLQLCLNFSQLKLLNIKYSNNKLNIVENKLIHFVHEDKWTEFVKKIQDEEAIMIWNNLLLTQAMAMEIINNSDEIHQIISDTKTNILKRISNAQILTNNNYFTNTLFRNLDKNQLKILTKTILKAFAMDKSFEIFQTHAIINNKKILQHILLKLSKNILDSIENVNSLSKVLKSSFEITSLDKNNVSGYFNNTSILNEEDVINNIEIFKHLQIYYLDEQFQLTAILVLLIVKNCNQNKKLKRSIDYILQSIYELSPKYPDLYKIFPINFIFDFNNSILDLLKLNKTSNSILILKSTLESAVKKVKTDPDIVKNIVDILLKNHNGRQITSIAYFDNSVFQISCLILPIIAKEKKAITTSAFRSILANLQDKLNNAMLDSFKNIDFNTNNLESIETATLNAMGAYSLTLLKCCETNDVQEIKNLDCLFSGLEFFVNSSIQSIQDSSSKSQHIETSIHLLNVTLRYIKKLESHSLFKDKDKLFNKIWESIKLRLFMVFNHKQKRKINNNCLDEISVTLKFLAELSSVECFCNHFVGDLSNLALLKKPSLILKNDDLTNSQLVSRRVSKYLWQTCLKANIIGPKCIAMTKLIFRATKNIRFWIQQHYDVQKDVTENDEQEIILNEIKVDDSICELLRSDLDVLSEVILAAKKITLDYKFLDAVFELFHLFTYILGCNTTQTKCVISWEAFVSMFEGCVVLLNNLLVSREEMLEDRWPCYMQCYKTLILCLCERAKLENDTDMSKEQKLAELAHTIEKLTQSICKRKSHVSRISAYAVADICTWIESKTPPKMLRQHLENSIALLIQTSDSTYAMAFLRRGLAGSIGQMTMTNMYTLYKRYHKYVGNA